MAKVMIADDSNSIRLILRDILSLDEHKIVAEAADGEEAVNFYQEHKPDILLLDSSMPKKDGLAVAREIMQYDSTAKIILITGNDDQKVIQQYMESGVESYISKPFKVTNILKTITKILLK